MSEFLVDIEDFRNDVLVDDDNEDIDVISTGSLSLDISIGTGGIPKGRITEIYGAESSGKTTLCLNIAKEAHKAGDNILYIDPEIGVDYKYAKRIIGDFEKGEFYLLQPKTAEDCFEMAERGITSGKFGLIIFDSIGALLPEKEMDDDFTDTNVALTARHLRKFCSRNAFEIKKSNVAFVFINQVRANIGAYHGGYSTPGGYALKHFASIIVFLSKGTEIKQDNETIGISTKFTIKKNKLGVPFRSFYLPILFNKGVDYVRDVIDFASTWEIINRRGSYYTFEGETMAQGMNNTVKYLEENENTLDKIVELCYNKFEIENPKRKEEVE